MKQHESHQNEMPLLESLLGISGLIPITAVTYKVKMYDTLVSTIFVIQ